MGSFLGCRTSRVISGFRDIGSLLLSLLIQVLGLV